MNIIPLSKIEDNRGNLTFIEAKKHVPFDIKRTYWVYDVPAGEIRGGYAFKQQSLVMVVLSGSVEVLINDGSKALNLCLTRSDKALNLPPLSWMEFKNFSTNTVCLFLSSHIYDEKDYIRDFNEFIFLCETRPNFYEHMPNVVSVSKLNRRPSVYDAFIIELSQIGERNGHITIAEGVKDLPFEVKRVFYIYDIPAGVSRGAHSHKSCHQFLVATSGAFEVQLDDGRNKRTVRLDRPYYGLYIPPGIWANEQSFSGGVICLALTSHIYSEDDYIRNYKDFIENLN
jgi:dTDP-4-dehydrorhamnose 3,5-epimerase-like enzyme